MSPREFKLFYLFFWQVNGKPIHLLDLSPWDKMHWNPLNTGKPCANREYLLGAYYMSDIVRILYKPYSWLSQQRFETVFISSFYWEGNWDLKRLSNLTNVLQVARGQPRVQLMSIKPECLLYLPRRGRGSVSKLWDLSLSFAEMNRKWITQSLFIDCLDSGKQPITH